MDIVEFVVRDVKDNWPRTNGAIKYAAYFRTSVEDVHDVVKEVKKK